jgi:hypothetical protein
MLRRQLRETFSDKYGHYQVPTRTHEQTIMRLAVNTFMIIPYVVFVSSDPNQVSPWWGLPMLLWGHWAFRQFANLNRLGSLTVPVRPWQFMAVSLFGAIFFAGFGIIVIPIFILYDIYQLMAKRTI